MNNKIDPESKHVCVEWKRNPFVNPRTGRAIKESGSVYKALAKECMENNKILTRGRMIRGGGSSGRSGSGMSFGSVRSGNGMSFSSGLNGIGSGMSLGSVISGSSGRSVGSIGSYLMYKYAKDIANIIKTLHGTCKTPLEFDEKIKGINERVTRILKQMHDDWVNNADTTSLLQANYLMDYYCSTLVRMCDTLSNKDCVFSWGEYGSTYEILLNEQLSYSDGLWVAHELIKDMAKLTVSSLSDQIPVAEHPYVFDASSGIVKDWKLFLEYVSLKALLDFIKTEIDDQTGYAANGWGMYRFVNMRMLKPGSSSEVIPNKKPCSCICITLLYILVLNQLGYPKELLFTLPQADSNVYKTRKKLTHWSLECKHPFKDLLERANNVDMSGYMSLDNRNMSSTYGFSLYTRDIVNYYRGAVFHYKVGNIGASKLQRMNAFDHLLLAYDSTFPGVNLKTPVNSP